MELKSTHPIDTDLRRTCRVQPLPPPHSPFYGIKNHPPFPVPPPPPLQLKFLGAVAKRGLYLLILKKFRVRIAVDFNNNLPK